MGRDIYSVKPVAGIASNAITFHPLLRLPFEICGAKQCVTVNNDIESQNVLVLIHHRVKGEYFLLNLLI